MLTQAQFNQFWTDFAAKFPACKEYIAKLELSKAFLDGVYQGVAAFDLDILTDLTKRMLTGEIDAIPNTQLGHIGGELRIRCRQLLELRRKAQPKETQEWQRWSPTKMLAEDPTMARMLQCAKAVDRLLGRDKLEFARDCTAYAMEGSVRANNGEYRCYPTDHSVDAKDAYDAAIIMADKHTPDEERQCLAAFSRAGLTWEQIQEEARHIPTHLFETVEE